MQNKQFPDINFLLNHIKLFLRKDVIFLPAHHAVLLPLVDKRDMVGGKYFTVIL